MMCLVFIGEIIVMILVFCINLMDRKFECLWELFEGFLKIYVVFYFNNYWFSRFDIGLIIWIFNKFFGDENVVSLDILFCVN